MFLNLKGWTGNLHDFFMISKGSILFRAWAWNREFHFFECFWLCFWMEKYSEKQNEKLIWQFL